MAQATNSVPDVMGPVVEDNFGVLAFRTKQGIAEAGAGAQLAAALL